MCTVMPIPTRGSTEKSRVISELVRNRGSGIEPGPPLFFTSSVLVCSYPNSSSIADHCILLKKFGMQCCGLRFLDASTLSFTI